MTATEASATLVRGLPFAARIVLSMVAIVLLVQFATVAAMRLAVGKSVQEQLHRELEVGRRVWEESHATRLRQLLDRVGVLSEDFGFKEAAATADAPTLRSALGNAGSRIGASHAILLDARGELVGSVLPGDQGISAAAIRSLHEEASREGFVVGVGGFGKDALSYAVVPVFAPDLIGWVGMGIPLGEVDLEAFSGITGQGAAILFRRDCRVAVSSRQAAHWTPDPDWCLALDGELAVQEFATLDAVQQEPVLVLRLTGGAEDSVHLVIQASRAQAMQPFEGLDRQVMWQSALAGLLVLLVAAWLGRRVSRPVGMLAKAAARIRSGDYATTLPVSGSDELALLADAFNRMQQGIAEREQRIVFQSGHDGLTGLPNRERALLCLREALSRAGEGERGALLMIDIRRFREINDLLGHAFGDDVLVKVAARLTSAVRSHDVVARLGGNEFLVLLAGVDAEAARQRAQRLGEALNRPLSLRGTDIRLELAMGMALYPDASADHAALVRRADIALNEAKAKGHLLEIYVTGHDERHLRQLRLIGDLRGVIGRGELRMAFQPKVDIKSGRVTHGEALLRWDHAELGPIPPDEFIPLAERAGLINVLTAYVLDQAIGQVARWREAGVRSGVAVNLSALDLGDPALPDVILATLKQHEVVPADLIVEVTESAVMQDLDLALETLHKLRRFGIRVAVDDFGTGHSSLAQLKRLPVDELKIDKSFVMTLLPGTDDEQIVHSIVQLAHALSMTVVAEGVESATGLSLLNKHGCETAQGYYFSKPLTADDYASWCRSREGDTTARKEGQ